jgi:hypothetical protein
MAFPGKGQTIAKVDASFVGMTTEASFGVEPVSNLLLGPEQGIDPRSSGLGDGWRQKMRSV